ncbi:hypothetical protein Bca52824_011270 [Brassica carinata]|uniref:Uncharacterized protein n=1 Tax=Brassica carinata TaxID=52824 RepID=A0A8X8BC26_BRACI|nr:hypothetical protein Bca52824_011270 [Brassica carinata]
MARSRGLKRKSNTGCCCITRCTSVPDLDELIAFYESSCNSLGVLGRAFYGVKVQTVYICSVFTAACSDSTNDLFDLPVSDKPLWAEIRDMLSSGRSMILKEPEAVDASVEKLYPMIQDGVDHVEVESFKDYVMELGTQADKLSQGLDQLLEEVDSFFKMTWKRCVAM